MANPLQLPFIFASATSPVSSVNLDNDFNYLAGTVLDTIPALRLTTPKTTGPPRVILWGSSAVGVGQTGFFWYNPADTTSADNGSTIIVAADGARWYYAAIQAGSLQGSHTLPDSVLSTNVPLLNASNTFTQPQLISHATDPYLQLTRNATAIGFFEAGSATELRLYGSASVNVALYTGGNNRLNVDPSGNFDFKAGLVTTSNASAQEVGFRGLPVTAQNGNYTLVLNDAGTMIYKSSGATATWTIPANASVAFPGGTTIVFANRSGNPQNIAITTDTLVLAGVGTTGTRSLASNGIATATKINSTEWLISGPGLS
jgi:hypothetical protein